RLIRLGRAFILGVEARDERQIRCPLRDRFERLAVKGGGRSHPEAVDRIGKQKHLDAAGAEPFQMWRGFEASDVVAQDMVAGGRVRSERPDLVFETSP